MKLSNQKTTKMIMFGLFCILFLDIAFMIIAKVLDVDHIILDLISYLILILGIWRIMRLKVFSVEISQHVLSIKYSHPLGKKTNIPVLEVPLEKVSSYKIERGIVSNFLILNIKTNRGKKSFYYQLGILKEKEYSRFRNIFNSIKSNNRP
ncbi:hypothetical protein [Epilithonimonas lactis]|uniref:PH domain-containing protein n=1 Tax=Epilithonimonas lactis TaxID=421072 RepID=A0A085B6A6_9FLAO|nr:hypothetical protein [Epilithonimonas lactis]KFC18001.1 hypothetical protein IO89_19590 [Epilithonimonas lactis]